MSSSRTDAFDDITKRIANIRYCCEKPEILRSIINEYTDDIIRDYRMPIGHCTLLHYAAKDVNCLDAVKILAHKVPLDVVDDYDDTALADAIYHGNVYIIRYLVNVQLKTERVHDKLYSMTVGTRESVGHLIHLVCVANQCDIGLIDFMIETGADITQKDSLGQTPADVAREVGDDGIADYLDSLCFGAATKSAGE
jgi:ankyrin repeat protein